MSNESSLNQDSRIKQEHVADFLTFLYSHSLQLQYQFKATYETKNEMLIITKKWIIEVLPRYFLKKQKVNQMKTC